MYPYYGYNKSFSPKLKNRGYEPPDIPNHYPFQSKGWFNYMRDYAPLSGSTAEQEAAKLTKNLVWMTVGTGIAVFMVYKYLL